MKNGDSSDAEATDPICHFQYCRLPSKQALGRNVSIRHPAIRVKHSVATLLNPRGVTTVSQKYSLTVARHATVVVAVPSAVHYPVNYKNILFKIKFKKCK
jgi:hypothetical protein